MRRHVDKENSEQEPEIPSQTSLCMLVYSCALCIFRRIEYAYKSKNRHTRAPTLILFKTRARTFPFLVDNIWQSEKSTPFDFEPTSFAPVTEGNFKERIHTISQLTGAGTFALRACPNIRTPMDWWPSLETFSQKSGANQNMLSRA